MDSLGPRRGPTSCDGRSGEDAQDAPGSGSRRWRQQGAAELAAERIVQLTGAAALATSSDNQIIAFNPKVLKLIGRTSSEIHGRNLQDVLGARDIFGNLLGRTHSAFHEMAQRFEPLQSFKMDICNAGGRYQRVGVSITVVAEASDGGHCLVYLFTPIDRRRRADLVIDQMLAGLTLLSTGSFSGEEARGAFGATRITDRQRQVLRLLADGQSSGDIAEELCISIHTVRSHIRKILDSLRAKNQIEAVAKALALRLI